MRTFPLQPDIVRTGADFSPCGKYRYQLSRVWDSTRPTIAWIGLNPSTATEFDDDPTVRRCIGFSRAWGCGGMMMLNLFAFRATDPREMKACPEPVGEKNDATIRGILDEATLAVAAWGNHGAHMDRAAEVVAIVGPQRRRCLGISKQGQPLHPLYQPGTARAFPFPLAAR